MGTDLRNARISIKLPSEVKNRWVARADQERRTLTEVIEQAMREYLKRAKKSSSA